MLEIKTFRSINLFERAILASEVGRLDEGTGEGADVKDGVMEQEVLSGSSGIHICLPTSNTGAFSSRDFGIAIMLP